MMGNYERTDPNLAQTECAFLSTLKQNKSNGRYRFFIRRLIFTEKKRVQQWRKKQSRSEKRQQKKSEGQVARTFVCCLYNIKCYEKKIFFPNTNNL